MTFRIRSIALLAVLFIASCAAVRPNLPSITDGATGARHDGRVVWRDLLTTTPEASRRFYGELFGWEFEKPGIDLGFGDAGSYMLIRHNGRLIGGMVDANTLRRDVNISQWVTVMSVSDINAAVGKVAGAGGEVLTEPTDVGDRGTLAVATGPDGALISFIETRDGDPVEREPAHNEWLWDELWTDDIDGSAAFFGAVAGLRLEERSPERSDSTYQILFAGDRPRAGVLQMPFEGEHPVWVNYLRVEDPSAITTRVEGLGGRVLLDVRERDVGGSAALIAGPSGAGVALQTWPLD
jgi:predicted enzyme related to lactoylglutathione lyase